MPAELADHRPGVAIIGYGFAGSCFHRYLIRLCDGLRLVGIASQRAAVRDAIASALGLRAYRGLEEALDDPAVELVVLATPNDLHAPQAIAAMQAGRHVVTDKPMALSLSEADAMLAASESTGRLLTVFHNRRWDGDFLTIQRVLAEGLLGQTFLFEMFWGRYGAPRGWRGVAAQGGGKFTDLGVHMIDQALQLVSARPTQVYARFRTDLLDNDVDDHAHCIISFADGTDVHIATSSVAYHGKPRWYVLGTAGSLVKEGLDPQERAMIDGDIDAAREQPANYARISLTAVGQPAVLTVETVPGRWRSFYDSVAAALRGDAALAVTPQSARATMAVLEAARRSAAAGRAVGLDEVEPR